MRERTAVQRVNEAVAAVGRRVQQLQATRRAMVNHLHDAKGRADQAEAAATDQAEALELLQALADGQRDALRARVEAVVDKAVKAVFGPSHAFRLRPEFQRGQMAVYPEVGKRMDGDWVWHEVSECGGGVHDVVSFAMRVVVLALYRPARRPVIIADEPFRHVSRAHLPAVADMVRQLADMADIQFIIVTHEPEIADVADAIYEASMVDGRTRLKPIYGVDDNHG